MTIFFLCPNCNYWYAILTFLIFFREIVGFIDEIEGSKIVDKAQHYQLLKFMVNNNSQHRVQVVVWNAEIDRIKHHIQSNRVSNHFSYLV